MIRTRLCVIIIVSPLCLVARLLATVPTVSAISIGTPSHSNVTITWTASGCVQNLQQIQFGLTSAYTGANSGIQYNAGFGNGGADPSQIEYGLSGLSPSTTYHFSPQSSCDNGATWSTPVDGTFTTAALPSPHPALPASPPAYTPTFPNTSGYNVDNTITTCSGTGLSNQLQVALINAVALQPINGTVIVIPAGVICHGTFFIPMDTNAAIKTVTVSGSTFTKTAHGYIAGQAIMFSGSLSGGSGGILTGMSYNGFLPSPLIYGEIYYVSATGLTANNFQVSLTNGGSSVTLTDAGTNPTLYVTQWPPYNRNAILIQTSTPDSSFTPSGVRTSPSWQPMMATLQVNVASTTGGAPVDPGMAINTGIFTHDVWFRGIEITHADQTALAANSNDPAPTFGFISTLPDNSYITFDRNYIHGLGGSNRVKYWISPWAGHYMAIQNSYISGLLYPRSAPSPGVGAPYFGGTPGLVPSVSGSVLSVGPGSTKMMNGITCTTSGLTWTNTGGSATSNYFLEVGLDCTPTLILPTGATATCTGNFSDGTTTHGCATTTQASPSFTLDSGGQGAKKNFTIANGSITSGVWGAATNDTQQTSIFNTEGTQAVYTGMGRGPYYLLNNYFSGAGLYLHMDDQFHGHGTNTANTPPSGYYYYRNTFDMPLSTILGNAASDGYSYNNREITEWKQGTNILIEGNVYNRSAASVSPYGCPLLFSSRSQLTISDIEVRYNTFRQSPCGIVNIAVPQQQGAALKGSNINRTYYHDDIFELNDAYTYKSTDNNNGQDHGIMFTHGYLNEDFVVDHVVVVDNRGDSPDWGHLIVSPVEGTSITNSIIWGNDDNGNHGFGTESVGQNTPSCPNGGGKSPMDCLYTQGYGTTSYVFRNNLLVPQFTNSKTLTGDANSSGQWNTAYSGFVPPNSVFIASGATPSARATGIGFNSFSYGNTILTGNNYRLRPSSAYISGGASHATDGKDLGPDMNALNVAQGTVSNARVRLIGATGATVSFYAPDAYGCTVDYGTDPTFATFSRASNAGGSRIQDVVLTSLTTGTTYYARINCAVQQPVVTFTPH